MGKKMNEKGFVLIFILSAILVIMAISTPASAATLDNNWHQFQKDETNIGITHSPAPPEEPTLAWSRFTSTSFCNGIDVTPIIAENMVYIYAANGSIWAFDKTNGDLIWMNETTGGFLQTSTPAYGDGKIFVATNSGDLFAFNATLGEELWNVHVTDRNFECPVTYANHKIYIGEGLKGGVTTKYYYCYDENGAEVWKHATDNTAGFLWCGASMVGDYLVFATHEGKLLSLYKNNGTLTDEVDLTSELSFSRHDLGKIRASVTYHDGYVYTTSENGQPLGYVWKVGFDADNGTFIDDGWSTPNGFSTSTPVVYDEKVYVGQGEHGFTGNLTCIDDSSGEIIWSYPVSGGVKSSPALSIQGGKLYIYFTASKITANNGSLYCLNADGTLAWEYNPPDDRYILQGAAISEGFIYFGTDSGYIYCIKEETEWWAQFHKDERHTGFSNSTAPDTNNTLWISDDIGAVGSSSPVVAEGKVFVNCGDSLKALNEYTGNILWNTSIAGSTVGGSWLSPSYHGGNVFISGKRVYCIDAKNGSIIWDYGLPSPACNGGTLVADRKVFAGDWSGSHCYCLDEETGEELWNFTVSGYAQGTPAFANGNVYFTSWVYVGGHVYCVDAETGSEIWHKTFDLDACGSATVVDDVVYFTTYNFYGDGDIYALDATNGSILWQKTIQRTDSTPAVTYGNVYVTGGCAGYSDVQTYCFNATSGELIWNTTASDGIGGWTCSVAVADGKVFVGKPGDFFGYAGTYALDAFTGDIIWSYPEGGSSPAVADGMVFTIGDGKVYAFGGASEKSVFDTGKGTYPSISGTHKGKIKPDKDITVNKMYTYPCTGTGGHAEYVKIWNESGWNVSASWNGYKGKGGWHNISFSESFILKEGKTYYYEIITGSYPQIIHEHSKTVTGGTITCDKFINANGKIYDDWIPAIKFFW
jgi:outer membrane protein assembly factor BamB